MINYILQVLLFQTVFLAVYDLVLKKETFFQWNRAYLIITSVLAYVVPLIRFTGAAENIPQEYRIMLPEVMLSPETFIEKQMEKVRADSEAALTALEGRKQELLAIGHDA